MNEPENPPPTDRLDLSALAPDAADSERVIGVVLASLASRPQRTVAPAHDVLAIVGRHLPRTWIAAAAAVAIIGSTVVVSRTQARAEPVTSTLAAWAAQQHVPTNGELLVAFQGYQR